MNYRRSIVVVTTLVLGSAIGRAASHDHKAFPRRPGVILFKLKAGASVEDVIATPVVARMGHISRSVAARSGTSRVAIQVSVSGRDEEDLARDLERSGKVEYAEPDYLLPAAAAPNDPDFSLQWFHQTIDSQGAWDITTGNSSIVVAVCDTGVDSSHPDLAGNLIPGYNVVNGTTDTSPVALHGTQVAGILGAVGNNGTGVAGVNWRVSLLPVRITNNSDTTAWCSDMANGVEWAADHGARVINLSYETSGCPNTIDSAAQYARSRGALVFLAAGNSAEDLSASYPVSPSSIMVGATDSSDNRAPFSNYGAPIDLMAPGKGIFTTQSGGGYRTTDGTSFASPMAAGVAALILSLNPNWKLSDVENFIFSTASPLGGTGMGNGRLNAGAALRAAKSTLQGNFPPVVTSGADQSVSFPGPVFLNGQASQVSAKPFGPLRVAWSKVSGPGKVAFSNSGLLATSAQFSYAGVYVLRLSATDGALTGSSQVTIRVLPGARGEGGLPAPILNLPPFLPLTSDISAGYPPGYSITTYEWTFQFTSALAGGAGAPSFVDGSKAASLTTTSNSADLSSMSLQPGFYTISVRAFDSSGVISEAAQASVTLVPGDLGNARIFPNPWRADRHAGHAITFDNLSTNATVKIFTLAGHQVQTLPSTSLAAAWDLKNETGEAVASGLYIYMITDDKNQKKIGKLAILR